MLLHNSIPSVDDTTRQHHGHHGHGVSVVSYGHLSRAAAVAVAAGIHVHVGCTTPAHERRDNLPSGYVRGATMADIDQHEERPREGTV